jgi:two-component system, cell cycle response regulator CtrA
LDLASRYDYDSILLDLKLPDMPGADVIRRLRAVRIETPVMVLSGSSRPETDASTRRSIG